jgi:hypothetical protein
MWLQEPQEMNHDVQMKTEHKEALKDPELHSCSSILMCKEKPTSVFFCVFTSKHHAKEIVDKVESN